MIYISKREEQGDEFQDIGNEDQDLLKDAQTNMTIITTCMNKE